MLRSASHSAAAASASASASANGIPEAAAARARRLADLSGGTLSDDGAAATVTFPGAATAGAAAPVLARTVASSGPPPLALAPHHARPATTGAALDLDEVYEHVASRLRRELLNDRERIGDLLGDLPGTHPPR